MFKYYATTSDIGAALGQLKLSPRLKQFHCSIQLFLADAIPGLSIYLYSYQETSTTYWLGVKPFGTFFHLYSAANGPVDRKDVQRFLLQALALGNGIADMCKIGNGMIFGDPNFTAETLSVLSKFGVTCESTRPVNIFAYSKAPAEPGIDQLPSGFTFDEIGEEDLEIVTGCWSFGLEGSGEAIRTRIQHLATVAIRSGSGNLAGFAMMNHDGMIIGVNVLPEYRGQRLRDALFAKLAHQTHAKFGFLPFYCCEISNGMMLKWIPAEHKVLNVGGRQAIILISSLQISEDAAENLQRLKRNR